MPVMCDPANGDKAHAGCHAARIIRNAGYRDIRAGETMQNADTRAPEELTKTGT